MRWLRLNQREVSYSYFPFLYVRHESGRVVVGCCKSVSVSDCDVGTFTCGPQVYSIMFSAV